MPHTVDTDIIGVMQEAAASLGIDPAKTATDKQAHDAAAYKMAAEADHADMDWSSRMYHAHVALGRLEKPHRPRKKAPPKPGRHTGQLGLPL